MVKNIVFDLAGVLIDFNPRKYLKHIGFDDKKIELFNTIIFNSEEWKKFDQNIYNVKDMFKELLKNYPQYQNEINLISNSLDYNYILFEIKENAEYLINLKKKNYNIYLLSDLSRDSYKFNQKFNFFNYIDGGVYSFEIGTTKPNNNNYIKLLDKYDLKPKETIFIDDRIENVEAANKLGIHGIQFTTLEEVKEKVDIIVKNLV